MYSAPNTESFFFKFSQILLKLSFLKAETISLNSRWSLYFLEILGQSCDRQPQLISVLIHENCAFGKIMTKNVIFYLLRIQTPGLPET